MKWVICGIIIGTGFITGSLFLMISLLQTPLLSLIGIWLILSLWVAILVALGYLAIYLLERKRLYNTHVVMLIPWLWMPLILLTPFFIRIDNTVNMTIEIPAVLVLLSVGGAWAHSIRLQKVAL